MPVGPVAGAAAELAARVLGGLRWPLAALAALMTLAAGGEGGLRGQAVCREPVAAGHPGGASGGGLGACARPGSPSQLRCSTFSSVATSPLSSATTPHSAMSDEAEPAAS